MSSQAELGMRPGENLQDFQPLSADSNAGEASPFQNLANSLNESMSRRKALRKIGKGVGIAAASLLAGVRLHSQEAISAELLDGGDPSVELTSSDDSQKRSLEKRSALESRSDDELLGMWNVAGTLTEFGQGVFLPAPAVDLSHLGDNTSYAIVSRNNNENFFPNYATASRQIIGEDGNTTYFTQGEYAGTSTVRIVPDNLEDLKPEEIDAESFIGRLIHVRAFFGDKIYGDLTQITIPYVLSLGFETSNSNVGIRFSDTPKQRPQIDFNGPPLVNLTEAVKQLEESDSPMVLQMRGISLPKSEEFQQQVVEILGVPEDAISVANQEERSDYASVFYQRLQDLMLYIAEEHNQVLLDPVTGRTMDIDISTHIQNQAALGEKDPLSALIDKLPSSQNWFERSEAPISRFNRLPNAGIIKAYKVPEVPLEPTS